MPNWCNNTVQITGPKKKLQQIKQAIEADQLLDYLYPMPKELDITAGRFGGDDNPEQKALEAKEQANLEKHGYSNWYDWRVEQWGTKWEVTRDYAEPEITQSSNGTETLNWSFDSAWAPPVGAYAHYLDKHDDVSIFATYYEPGCDFMGVWDSGDDRGYTPGDYDSQSTFWTNNDDGVLLNDTYGITESMAEYEAEQETEAEVKVRELVVEKKAQNLDQLKIGEEI